MKYLYIKGWDYRYKLHIHNQGYIGLYVLNKSIQKYVFYKGFSSLCCMWQDNNICVQDMKIAKRLL
jgi:hypothetical protein